MFENQTGSSWLRDPSPPQHPPTPWKGCLAEDFFTGCEVTDLSLLSIIYSHKLRSFCSGHSAFFLTHDPLVLKNCPPGQFPAPPCSLLLAGAGHSMTSWAQDTLLYVLCPNPSYTLVGVHPHDLIFTATSVELYPHKVIFQRTDVLGSLLKVLAALGGSFLHTCWEARLSMCRTYLS